ncbi:uncharacterized protein LOC131613465 [Vicia villosa]|uniref:uncharacterized protein LOC131613465 n=1 Tax=Vicia villosa TaxID=3911 RepID=UPI00273BE78D|nr:uncharacterized protein LOC131613465 [Vicia villosa]
MLQGEEDEKLVEKNRVSRNSKVFPQENSQQNAKLNPQWLETRQRLKSAGEVITWAVFRREFLRRYYPKDVREKKDIEFLELKQGNLSVTEYAASFVELAKFYPHYNEATGEFSKCIKLENGLLPEIKKAIGYQKIRNFLDLVDSYRIYEEKNNAHYKFINENRRKHQQNHGKPYDAPAGYSINAKTENRTFAAANYISL